VAYARKEVQYEAFMKRKSTDSGIQSLSDWREDKKPKSVVKENRGEA